MVTLYPLSNFVFTLVFLPMSDTFVGVKCQFVNIVCQIAN
jgi:hypothetical protein